MKTESFFSYGGYRWMWINLITVLVMTGIYLWHQPIGGPNGGTVLGYTYGGIATTGILFLMWYGLRKRGYSAHRTTLLGTLSAHVWIGIALIFIVPLHAGWSFGWNVHTLAYVLMLVVIFSGIWGAIMYRRLPRVFYSQRGGGSVRELMEQIKDIETEAMLMTQGVTAEAVSDDATMVQSAALSKLWMDVNIKHKPSLSSSLSRKRLAPMDRAEVANMLVSIPDRERDKAVKIIGLVDKKRQLLNQLQDEVRIQSLLKIWLFIHVPVSIGLVVCLAAHILSVFYYW